MQQEGKTLEEKVFAEALVNAEHGGTSLPPETDWPVGTEIKIPKLGGFMPTEVPKITIEIRPGRWGKIFHLFDGYGGEVKYPQKEALKLARTILKEQNK